MILNINKPKEYTSFDVVAKVRSVLRKKRNIKKVKVGHAGTLDPLATGVLIVLTDSDTKRQSEFMLTRKEYLAKIAFGAYSKTYDLEGDMQFDDKFLANATDIYNLKNHLEKLFLKYIGEIDQTVPFFSAVKVDGTALYKKAREKNSIKMVLPVKRITIYDIKLKSLKFENVLCKTSTGEKKVKLPTATVLISCGSGTYIRSLANDWGRDLNTKGVLVDLVRTKVGDFSIDDATKISELPVLLE